MRNGSLRLLRDKFGRKIVAEAIAARQFPVGSGAKSRTCVIEALCVCIDAEPEWSGPELVKAMSRCDLERFYREARAKEWQARPKAKQIPDTALVAHLVDMIAAYLDVAIPQRSQQPQQAA